MKKIIMILLAAMLLLSVASCVTTPEENPSQSGQASPTGAPTPALTGTENTDTWAPDEGVAYEKYDFLGRGEELLKEVVEKYPGYTVKYKLDGRTTNTNTLNSAVNLMAYYEANSTDKTLTVNIDTIDVRVQCDYTSLSAASGEFIVIPFTTNLPTIFIGSIGDQGSTKGVICHEGIVPEGKNGTYTGNIKLTVPYVDPGNYYLNISIDSGNAGFPFLMSIPFTISEGTYSDSEYKLLYTGDWDLITASGYQESLTRLFYNSYPKIYTRFATGAEPKTITFEADKSYDGVAYAIGTKIVVSVDYANSNPGDIGFFSHEITHSAQQYGNNLNYGDDAWWTENLANYGGFRYFHWASAEYVQVYTADDTSLQDWGYEAYGNNKWFFAYMDAKYPTTKESYGLIDSINRLVKNNTGAQLNDDPYDTTSRFNQVVKEITGFDCMESLRLQYVKELKEGTWAFTGFGNYPDNFITENLPNVENPVYPMVSAPVHGEKTAKAESAVTTGDNLCANATIYKVSGQVNNSERAALLIDGNASTKWCSTTGSISNQQYSLDGTRQWVIIDLGAEKNFNTYTILNTKTVEPGYGNMTEWELLISSDANTWTSVDYQPSCNRNKASFNIGNQHARYIMLRIYNPDDSQAGTVRLYEFMLF